MSASRERVWLLLLPRLPQLRQMQQEGSFPAWKEEWDGSEGSSSSSDDDEEAGSSGGGSGSSSEDSDDDMQAEGEAEKADEEAHQQPAPRRSSRVRAPAPAAVGVLLASTAPGHTLL